MTLAQGGGGKPDTFFVPGGRIGFAKPEEVNAWANSWILLSRDHTFSVTVREILRLGPYADSSMWDKDDRSQQIDTSLSLPGFEVRRFRDLRYEPSLDHAAQSIVLRDADWIGEVDVSNGNHGKPTELPGQNARWQFVVEQVLNSIVVRPRLPVAGALAELRVGLDTTGLNPRLVGENLILSLYTPKNASEAWGANHATIRTSSLTLIPFARGDAGDRIGDEISALARGIPGSRVLESAFCKGLLLPENRIAGQTFATAIYVYGRARSTTLTAFYNEAERGPLVEALHRVFQSIELRDLP